MPFTSNDAFTSAPPVTDLSVPVFGRFDGPNTNALAVAHSGSFNLPSSVMEAATTVAIVSGLSYGETILKVLYVPPHSLPHHDL